MSTGQGHQQVILLVTGALLLVSAPGCRHDLDHVPRLADSGPDRALMGRDATPDSPDAAGPDQPALDLPASDLTVTPDLTVAPDVPVDLPAVDAALADVAVPDLPSADDLTKPDAYVSVCNNGILDKTEKCDGAKLGGKTCKSQGFFKGTLACTNKCTLDTSGCSNCGNGKLDAKEECEGALLGGKTCAAVGMVSGKLACTSSCELDRSGCVWIVSAGGDYNDAGWGVEVDAKGNSFWVGDFKGQATFGTKTTIAKGSMDLFVSRLGPSGKFLWTETLGNVSATVHGGGVALDKGGNIYITGHFMGGLTIGTQSYNASGQQNMFVVKLDPTGKALWSCTMKGGVGSQGYGLAVDGLGQLLVAGTLYGTVTFQCATGKTKVLSTLGVHDAYVARLTSAGALVWIRQAGGVGNDYGGRIAADGAGNSTVAGVFSGTASFGSTTLTSKGQEDVYVARLDPSGTFVWASSAGGAGREGAAPVDLDGSGDAYIAGHFGPDPATFGVTTLTSKGAHDVFVARVNTKGKFVWVVSAGGAAEDGTSGIKVSPSGDVLVTGQVSGAATFGKTSLGLTAPNDAFVARLDSSGKFLGATLGGLTSGSKYASGHAITTDTKGDAYVIGSFTGQMTQGGATIKSTVASFTNSDVFLWKLLNGTP